MTTDCIDNSSDTILNRASTSNNQDVNIDLPDSDEYFKYDDELTSFSSFPNNGNVTNQSLSNKLRMWIIEENITRSAADKLLCILKESGHPDLPKSSETLLKTCRSTVIRIVEPGQYLHYGILTYFKFCDKHFSKQN